MVPPPRSNFLLFLLRKSWILYAENILSAEKEPVLFKMSFICFVSTEVLKISRKVSTELAEQSWFWVPEGVLYIYTDSWWVSSKISGLWGEIRIQATPHLQFLFIMNRDIEINMFSFMCVYSLLEYWDRGKKQNKTSC